MCPFIHVRQWDIPFWFRTPTNRFGFRRIIVLFTNKGLLRTGVRGKRESSLSSNPSFTMAIIYAPAAAHVTCTTSILEDGQFPVGDTNQQTDSVTYWSTMPPLLNPQVLHSAGRYWMLATTSPAQATKQNQFISQEKNKRLDLESII